MFSSTASALLDSRVPLARSNVMIRLPKPARRALKIATLVTGEYNPATDPWSPAVTSRVVNSRVVRFLEIKVPIDQPVVP